jgi:hypothetical protein
VIQHIVLFTPKDGLSDEERRRFAKTTLEALSDSPDIARYTVGRRVEIDPGYPRSFGDGSYEYAAVLEFDDRDSLVRYLTSTSHAQLGRLFWETCGKTIVMEVEVGDPKAGIDTLV